MGMNTGAQSTSLTFGNYTMWGVGVTTDTANWHHYAATIEGNTINVYLDGVLANNGTQNLNITGNMCRIGAHNTSPNDYRFNGYLAGLRVYNRVLDTVEIGALASEFTPSA